jgi:hypothetical protein
MGPNGNFDPIAAMGSVANNPAAALAAPGATAALLEARTKNIANATAAVALQTTQMTALSQYLAGFAGKTLTPQDVNTIRAGAVRLGGDPTTFGAITTPKQAMEAVKNAQIFGAGAGAGISPTPAGPDQNLAPTATTMAEAARGGGGVAGSGARVIGPSPDDQANQQLYLADKTRSAQIVQGLRPLEQALPLVSQLSHFNYGPGSEDIAKVKGLLTMLGITGVDPTSEIAVRQEVGKKLLQYASGARDAGRSDSALATAIASNPNIEHMTEPSVVNLIKNQIGMDKQDAAAVQAAPGWKDYQNFKNQWYNATDPRGFTTMNKDDLVNLAKSAKGSPKDPGSERSKLNRSIGIARQLGFAQPPE